MRYIKFLFLIPAVFLFVACHHYDNFDDDAYGNFDALWTLLNEHYCYFEEKGIDWEEVGARYRARIQPGITVDEYFNLLSGMLFELKDGHVNLVAPFNQSYYREWWSDYPQDFDLRTLQQYYLDFDYRTTCGIIYKILGSSEDVGYLYYPSFSYDIGEGNLDYILSWFNNCRALIIDVRNNGGGNLTNINPFVSRFISEEIVGGYIRHKTGPAHQDFSDPYPIRYKPAPSPHISWNRPVIILTNRSTFSAANDFVSVMKSLTQATVIGARTGGGGGMPMTYTLPIGWSVRLSVSPVSDAMGKSIESGIEPTEGYEVHAMAEELAAGKDAILDEALRLAATFPAISE